LLTKSLDDGAWIDSKHERLEEDGMGWTRWGVAGSAGLIAFTMFVSTAVADRPDGNGLRAQALLRNALTTNPKAVQFLRDNALNSGAFDAAQHEYMNRQLTDDRARAVMHDLVSCALDSSTTLTYKDRFSGTSYTWKGFLGLCPNWSTGKPSEECLQRVSACLFARVNGLHRHVPVLLGSHDFGPSRDKLKVEVEKAFPKGDPNDELSKGTLIESFSQGWMPGYIGNCKPNNPVSLAIQGAGCAQTSLRVCRGIYGCNGSNADAADHPLFVQEKNGACSNAPLTFACPAGGYYGLMTKPQQPEVTPLAAGGGQYPAVAGEVFSYIEGAFFGNLFDPNGLTHFREMILKDGHPVAQGGSIADAGADDDEDTVPHRNIYACFTLGLQEDAAQGDDVGAAYINARVCAKPGKKCFPNPPRRCHFKDTAMNNEVGYHCKWMGDEGVYQDCRGDQGVTYSPITVRLNDPCSLIDDRDLCGRLQTVAAPSVTAVNAEPPQPLHARGGCGACSVDRTGAALPSTSLAALFAFLLNERRRRHRGASRATGASR
jgi:hypothetical protein